MKRIGGVAVALLTLLVVGGRLWAVQDNVGKGIFNDNADPKTTNRIRLGSGSGGPGDPVVIPIYFTPAEGAKAGKLRVEIEFVSANLKYEKMEPGISADTGNVKVSGELKTSKNEKGLEISTVTVQASLPASGAPPQGIPGGLLAYVNLRISEKGRPATVTLRGTAEATELASDKPLSNLRVYNAQVEVMSESMEPNMTCFFFSH